MVRLGADRDKKVIRRGSRIAILEPLKGGCRIVLLYIYIYIYIYSSYSALPYRITILNNFLNFLISKP